MFVMLDQAGNANRTTGKLFKDELVVALQGFFPDKNEERMAALKRSIDEDVEGDIVEYKVLFEEDREYNQGAFAEEVKDQQLQERVDYLNTLENNMWQQVDEDYMINDVGIMRAFRAVDSNISKDTLKFYLERCFNGKYKDGDLVDVLQAMNRVRKGVVKKESKFKSAGSVLMKAAKNGKQNKGAIDALEAVRAMWIEKEMAGVRLKIPDGEAPPPAVAQTFLGHMIEGAVAKKVDAAMANGETPDGDAPSD